MLNLPSVKRTEKGHFRLCQDFIFWGPNTQYDKYIIKWYIYIIRDQVKRQGKYKIYFIYPNIHQAIFTVLKIIWIPKESFKKENKNVKFN